MSCQCLNQLPECIAAYKHGCHGLHIPSHMLPAAHSPPSCSVVFQRSFFPTERNHDITNRELLAVKMALEEWLHWLEGATNLLNLNRPQNLWISKVQNNSIQDKHEGHVSSHGSPSQVFICRCPTAPSDQEIAQAFQKKSAKLIKTLQDKLITWVHTASAPTISSIMVPPGRENSSMTSQSYRATPSP